MKMREKLRNLLGPLTLVVTLTLALSISQVSFAKDPVVLNQRPNKSLVWPKADHVNSALDSVDQAFSIMETTVPYDSNFPDRVRTGVNTNDEEVKRLEALLDGKIFGEGIDPQLLAINTNSYGIADPRLAELYIRATKMGLREIHLTVDLNRCITEDAKKRKVKIWDLQESDFIPGNTMSKFILDLKNAGMKFAKPGDDLGRGYYIYSIPGAADTDEKGRDVMTDIMHLKSDQYVYYSKEGPKIFSSLRTYNLTETNRENRGWIDSDPLAAEYHLQKSKDFQKAFSEGLEIWQIPSRPPRQINYKDGTYQEIGYTDGKYNPGDRLITLLKGVAKKVINYIHFVMSAFAATDRDFIDAFEGTYKFNKETGRREKTEPGILEVNPTPSILAVTEGKFSSTNDWGIPAYFSGFDLHRPRPSGVVIWGMKKPNRKNVRAFIFQGPNDSGHERTDANGPPTQHILHDKTSMLFYEGALNAGIEKLAAIFTGSLNPSNHFGNLEMQLEIVTRASSWIAQAINESVEQMVRVYSEPEHHWVVDGPVAVFRDTLARFIDHFVEEIRVEDATEIFKLFESNQYDLVVEKIVALAKTSTASRKKLDIEVVKKRATALVTLAKSELFDKFKLTGPQIESLLSSYAANPEEVHVQMNASLKRIFWGQGANESIQKASKILEVDGPVPTHHANAENIQDHATQSVRPAKLIQFRNCLQAMEL